MKKIAAIAFLIVFLGTNVCCQTLKNASFEEGSISGWQFTNPAFYGTAKDPGFTCTTERSTDAKRHVAKLQNTGEGVWCQLRQKIAFRTNGQPQKIRLALLVKTAKKHSGYVSIAVKPLVGQKGLAFIERKLDGNTNWKTLTTEAILPAKTDSLVVFCTMTGDGTAWLDKVSLIKLQGKISQSVAARKYLDTAIFVIDKHALYKDSVDFKGLIEDAKVICADAKKTADCYAGIRYLLEGLSDHHSFLKTPEEASSFRSEKPSKLLYPSGKIINNQIGYVLVPSFSGINKKLETRYADSLHNLLRTLDSKKIIGWIVDVRNNTGGNGFPMELGLGPIIGNGISNRKIKNGVVIDSSGYWDGETKDREGIILNASHPYSLFRAYPHVAVLTNGMTASSGEGVVLRFKNRPDTRIFGEATYGNTSANTDFILPDGAMMFVATHLQTDRLGNGYGGKIYPDVAISDDEKTTNDEVLDTAVKWLTEYKSK